MFNSLKNFIIVNGFITSISFIQYILLKRKILPIILVFLIRNSLILNFINYTSINKEKIQNTKLNSYINKNVNFNELKYYFITTTLIESLTHLFIQNYILLNTNTLSLLFIPKSFVYEIIFDFFHYITHFYLHYNKYLYKNLHKIHHKFSEPIGLITFYQHPIDLLITNSIPTILALILTKTIFRLNYLEFNLIIIYKIFIEICGHIGKKSYPTSSFPQCIWLPKILKIELYTEDHDLHHSQNNCNYSKRFSLWDRVFNTYHSFY